MKLWVWLWGCDQSPQDCKLEPLNHCDASCGCQGVHSPRGRENPQSFVYNLRQLKEITRLIMCIRGGCEGAFGSGMAPTSVGGNTGLGIYLSPGSRVERQGLTTTRPEGAGGGAVFVPASCLLSQFASPSPLLSSSLPPSASYFPLPGPASLMS